MVEASRKSGSLITAELATQEGREVYAVPGPIDAASSMGTNHLIQKGARLVVSADDILQDLSGGLSGILKNWQRTRKPAPDSADLLAGSVPDPVIKLLEVRPFYFDELVKSLDELPSRLFSRLTRLELEGQIRKSFGGLYSRS